MAERTRIYFASDLHLGMHPLEESRPRELCFIQWLDEIREDAKELWDTQISELKRILGS